MVGVDSLYRFNIQELKILCVSLDRVLGKIQIAFPIKEQVLGSFAWVSQSPVPWKPLSVTDCRV